MVGLRISFHEELNALEASLQTEGELVLRSLRGAVSARSNRTSRAR